MAINNTEVLKNVKTLLEFEQSDTSKDELLNLYISRATNYIKNHCKIETVPDALQDTIEEMVIFQYRQKGVENIKSEGKGSLSESYIEDYPVNIMNSIKPYKRAIFL